MVTIIPNPKRMTRAEIKETYKGKWVFMVDADGPGFGTFQYQGFETACPVVIADEPWEDSETDIYTRYNHKHEGNFTILSLFQIL